MAIATVDDIAAGLAAPAQRIRYLKNLTAPKAAGAYQSAWLGTGNPAAGAAPPAYTAGSGYTSDDTTLGAPAYANGAVQNYLARLAAMATQPGTILLLDRLWSCSGMGFAAATYAVTTPGSLPARVTDNGLNAELWVEQYVAAGAASGTLTVNYVDSAAAAKSGVIPVVVSAPVVGQLQPVPLANALGVKQLTNAINSATWTSGSWGMLIAERLAEIPIPGIGQGQLLDYASLGLPRLKADSCLMFAWLAQNTTAPVIIGSLDVIDK